MVLQEIDPAIVELKRIVENELALRVKFVYADIFEFNNDADLMQDAEFPCFLYFAQDRCRYTVGRGGVLVRNIPIAGMMLTQYESPAADYKAQDVNHLITQMRGLAENLVYRLNYSDYSKVEDSEGEGGVSAFNADSVYGKSDKHLFGVGVTFDWKMTEGKTGYHA